jgi:redox-sensitive bicupin YhaK (pirin superfamily)
MLKIIQNHSPWSILMNPTALRTIKNIFPAFQDDIADLHTVRPIPSPKIEILDPFLFLNHHGPQEYRPHNRGLPFGPHPHRGFQTVTFILAGDIAHKDSAGHESIIGPGGVQWMSAGRGLIHEEVSSEAFKRDGGHLEILQLWVNLPAKLKMSEPYYKGLQVDEIPVVKKDSEKISVQVIAGEYSGTKGPFKPSTNLSVLTLDFKAETSFSIDIPTSQTKFFYVVQGAVEVNGSIVEKENLVEFNADGIEINITAIKAAYVLLCFAEPYNEPVAFGGPFVMNTQEEIRQAMRDFQAGKFN